MEQNGPSCAGSPPEEPGPDPREPVMENTLVVGRVGAPRIQQPAAALVKVSSRAYASVLTKTLR